MLFSMAAPPMNSLEEIFAHTGWFVAGAGLYLLWAVLTTHLLNQRFRAQLLAECLYSFPQRGKEQIGDALRLFSIK